MGKLGEAICCFTEVTLIGCWGHTSEKRIIFCFCTHFVNIHSGINTTTSELKKKGRNWLLLHVFFQDTRHGHHIITLLYMFPFFPISTLKSTLRVWPVSIGCSMPHRTLSYPYFFQVRVCFVMQLFSIFFGLFIVDTVCYYHMSFI